jgi:hypothetical protein
MQARPPEVELPKAGKYLKYLTYTVACCQAKRGSPFLGLPLFAKKLFIRIPIAIRKPVF